MTVLRLEELTAPALDALDRSRTLAIVAVSPLEQHGPHLPVGVDYLAARHFAEAIAERIVTRRPGWTVVLTPTLPLGSFTFQAVGTIAVRQRVVRDAVVDYGRALARAGFRYILVSNGHAGPGHLVALEEAAAIVSRRHPVAMASFTGHMAWEFFRGRYLARIEAALGRPLTAEERRAFSDDAHGGWWETSLMLMLRPDLVDPGFRDLPPARYPLAQRVRPNYPLRGEGQGYVGDPARADLAFAKAMLDVLVTEAAALAERLLDGRLEARHRRSPFRLVPFLRTDFWPVAGAALAAGLAGLWLGRPARRRRDDARPGTGSSDPRAAAENGASPR
ncbi:MAG TPA: creatininase family protein [Methylomirabilota bacterium]